MTAQPDASEPPTPSAFVALCGTDVFGARVQDLAARAQANSLRGRAMQQRHTLELALARLAGGTPAGPADRQIAAIAAEAVRVATTLPPPARDRFCDKLVAALAGDGTLVPVFHLLRTAARLRHRGYLVAFPGLVDDAPHDLLITRAGMSATVACETVSAEEGRKLHRGDWFDLVDRVNPELQTWLQSHPGRYLLKMTLPEGVSGPAELAALHDRISAMLAAEKRQDAGAQAVLKLDPLVLAGAQAADRGMGGLPARLRAQFGPEAHLAVTTCAGGGSVFVMAARAGRENEIASAVCRRLSAAATDRLKPGEAGILAVFLEDIDRLEWRALREQLQLEGAIRRFLTAPEAKRVVAVSCASRFEMFGTQPPDSAPEGELRFRNPSHTEAKNPALNAAVASSA